MRSRKSLSLYFVGIFLISLVAEAGEPVCVADPVMWTADAVMGMQHPISIRLFNAGDSTLLISQVVARCKCLHIKTTAFAIESGKESLLEALYDADKPGKEVQTLYILSNDPINPVVEIPLMFDVITNKPDVHPPKIIIYASQEKTTNGLADLTVKNNERVVLQNARTDPTLFYVETKTTENEAKIMVSPKTSRAHAEDRLVLTFSVHDKYVARTIIPIEQRAMQNVQVYPEVVRIARANYDGEIKRRIVLQSDIPIFIKEVTASTADILVNTHEVYPHKHYEIYLSVLVGGIQNRDGDSIRIVVERNDSWQEISIPIEYF